GGGGDVLTLNDTGDDTAGAREGRNIVIGDSGYIDWTAADFGRFYAATTFARGTLSGDDSNALDIDRIFSTEPDHGGNDTITTGAGDDIIIGGEDGELVQGIHIAGSGAPEIVVAAATDGDTIVAGTGNNLVLGDAGT